jgi:hypothetical protein
MSKKEKNVYIVNRQFIFVLKIQDLHVLSSCTATHEIFIFIPLDENRSCKFIEKQLINEYPPCNKSRFLKEIYIK